MNQIVTKGIVLSRTDYGEADRIVTFLTPDQGKLRLMARGVRKIKSKLAAGIELFSVSDITFIRGKGEIGTLISARLNQNYGRVVQNIERVQLGYDLIKSLNKATEDQPEPEYFELLAQAFAALDDTAIDTELIRLWFGAQLLRLAGHSPNLRTDAEGQKLDASKIYGFDLESMGFTASPNGKFSADHIKLLRLVFAGNPPGSLQQIQNLAALLLAVTPQVQAMLTSYIRL